MAPIIQGERSCLFGCGEPFKAAVAAKGQMEMWRQKDEEGRKGMVVTEKCD